MWYCTLVKELQYYMDSCEEVLKKRQQLDDEDEQKVNLYIYIYITYQMFDVKVDWSKEKIEFVEQLVLTHC